jgi:adenylate cyclase
LPEGARRLAAIMFTDLVGYSSITSLDEEKALKLLREHRQILQSVFEKYQGRVVKTMGDGFLVEFASAVEAVNCAVQAQIQMRTLNENHRQDQKILVRIGIHVGDIVHSNGDILGDAVNVAARLQPISEPGGICLTKQAVDQIERKVAYKMMKLGTRELKNIRYPVELYKVEVPTRLSQSEEPTLDPRRIAILPFANLSSDPSDRYFADGMTEELISTVSLIGELSVISRTSVMRYKDTTMPIGDIGRELSAGSLLEGSVRKAGNKVRITTQLIDAKNDKHLWAQSYDRDLTDIFAIQGDIAGQVAQALRVKLLSTEKAALEKMPTRNSESYTLYLKGRYLWNERTQDGIRKAMRYFQEAIRLDPSFALAYSGLADCYQIQLDRGWASYREAGSLALEFAGKAIELDDDLAEGHASLGLALEYKWDFAEAENELKQAIRLKPNYAMAYHWYSNLLGILGRNEEAFENRKRAFELDPYSSIVSQGFGIGYLSLGRNKEAITQFERTLEIDPEFASAYFWKAWAHERAGELEQAIAEAKKAVEIGGTGNNTPKMGLTSMYLRAGQREPAIKLLREIQSEPTDGSYRSPAHVAIIKFELGESDEAFRWLEQAYQEHDGFLLYFGEYPWWAEYRKDPRWLEIERKIGLSKKQHRPTSEKPGNLDYSGPCRNNP